MASFNDKMIGEQKQVSAAAFAAKYRSKKECFEYLTVACRAYLSSYHT
jgi:hypothetical protein